MNVNGNLVISLDFELLWGLAGWESKQIDAYVSHIQGSVYALKKILEIFRRYDMKCTIAFVGCMNYSSIEDLRSDLPKIHPKYKNELFSSQSSLIPQINNKYQSELFFCSDLITELSTDKNVELASHTFSHYYCLEEGQSILDFKNDIRAVLNNARKNNICMSSIIFPRNQVAKDYLELCKYYGFTHYRGTLNNLLYKSNKTCMRYSIKGGLRLLDTYFNISGSNTYNVESCMENCLIDVPGSRFFRPYSNSLSFLEKLKLSRIKKSMKYAAKHGQIYHLWWHPHNFGNNTKENIQELEEICKYFKELQNLYNIQSSFISDIK